MNTEYKAIRAANWRDLMDQLRDHLRRGWRTVGHTDIFDNEWGGADWVQPLKREAIR